MKDLSSPRSRWAGAALLLAFALTLAAGCSGNRPGTILAPTGPRPAPENPTGGVFGFVRWDPTNAPDLATAPFPPTLVQARTLAGDLAGVDTLDTSSDRFEIRGLPPGTYIVGAGSRAFRTTTLPAVQVVDTPRDVDAIVLPINADSTSVTIWLIGRMPGFSYDEFFDNSLIGLSLGLWSYPNDLSTPREVTAGTHRFKFVTDPSFPNDLIGWGGDSTVVLTAPVNNAKVRFGRGPAHDLKVTFPTTGLYTFTLDERRQTFSVQLAPPSALAARRSR